MIRSKVNALSVVLLIVFSVLSARATAEQYVEQWLQPVVPIKSPNGDWIMKSVDELPNPPISVLQQQGELIQIKLRRVGPVWVPKTALRLFDESLLLTCQTTATARAVDYKNYGMRGDEGSSFTCIVK